MFSFLTVYFLFLLEFWRSADELKVIWNVLCTMPKGGRSQSPASPRLEITVVRYIVCTDLLPSSLSTLLAPLVE